MPRPARIDRAQIIATALAIVDAEGLDALTMRRIGEALGVEAMSLYRHVANKEAVLDGIHEALLEAVAWPVPSGRWPCDLRDAVMALRDALRAHPRALPLLATRPAITQASLAHLERALALLEEPFADPLDRVRAVQTLLALVIGHAMVHDAAQVETGPDYAALDATQFPQLVATAPLMRSYDPDGELLFAVDSLIAAWS